MSDPDNFLSRWSRRKLEPAEQGGEAVVPETQPPAEAQPGPVESRAPAASESMQVQTQEPPFDPASLPPVESITAGTDIRDFLKPGVPVSLSRAALRRAWISDPAIRDFIEIAENQGDFTNNSIPGFGPIDPGDVPRLLAQIINSGKGGAEAANTLAEEQSEPPPSAPSEKAAAERAPNVETDSECAVTARAQELPTAGEATEHDTSHRNKENDAAQNGETDGNLNYAHVRHGHGSALPT